MLTLEKTIQQFVEDEHDISLAFKGSTKGYYNPKSQLVVGAANRKYANICDFQEIRFKEICNYYELTNVQLKNKIMEYQLK